jgi:hypothetical protein
LCACGLAIAVKNARAEVKREGHYVAPYEGGDGALRDAAEYILKGTGQTEERSRPLHRRAQSKRTLLTGPFLALRSKAFRRERETGLSCVDDSRILVWLTKSQERTARS